MFNISIFWFLSLVLKNQEEAMRKKKKIVYFSLLLLILFFTSISYYSYAFFTHQVEEHGKLNIVAGTLNYEIKSKDLESNQMIIEANHTKKIVLEIISLNSIDSMYELYYFIKGNQDHVKINYSSDTKDIPMGVIEKDGKKIITVIINNDSNDDVTVEFGVIGGLKDRTLVLTEGNELEEIKVVSLQNTILTDNLIIQEEPNLEMTSQEVGENGLYVSNDTNDGKSTYYFRGAIDSNYVKFAGFLWRIIRIHEDGSIRLIMQDGINNNAEYSFYPASHDQYTDMYYSNTNLENGAMKILEDWYKKYIEEKGYANQTVASSYCEQAKVAYNKNYAQGSMTDMKSHTEYVPNFKCENDRHNYGLLTLKIGLITYDEIAFAGSCFLKNNEEYYLYNGKAFSGISPAGFDENEAIVWGVNKSGSFSVSTSDYLIPLRPVINLNQEVTVIGNGTITNPFSVID